MKNDLIIDYNKMFMCAYWIWCSPSPQMFHHFQQVYYDQRYHVCLVQHHVICLVQDRVPIHHQTWVQVGNHRGIHHFVLIHQVGGSLLQVCCQGHLNI